MCTQDQHLCLCDIIATKKRNFGLELDETTICCVKFHPHNSEVDIPPYAVRWRRSEVILRNFDDGEERFNLEVRADAREQMESFRPHVIVAVIFLWAHYKGRSMQKSIVRLGLAAVFEKTRVEQDWSRKASSDLSGRFNSNDSLFIVDISVVILMVSGEAQVWSRPTWRRSAEASALGTWRGWSALTCNTLGWHNSKPSWRLSYRGVRIGEAKNPGPPPSQPHKSHSGLLRRARRRRPLGRRLQRWLVQLCFPVLVQHRTRIDLLLLRSHLHSLSGTTGTSKTSTSSGAPTRTDGATHQALMQICTQCWSMEMESTRSTEAYS